MMTNHPQVNELQEQIFDICMELDSQSQAVIKQAAVKRHLTARRAIEEHAERKQLRQAMVEYDFD